MKGKMKIIAGILIALFCILLGCRQKEQQEESLLILSEDNQEADGEEAPDSGATSKDETVAEPSCVVHICGAVLNPGVFTFPAGSRVYQAVEAAGGFEEDAAQDYLNQADLLADGMKIYVPTLVELEELSQDTDWVTEPSSGIGMMSENMQNTTETLVNINQADEEVLCTLPGIGSNKAQSIIEYRLTNGDYKRIEDIMLVAGIKEGLFQKIKDRITI